MIRALGDIHRLTYIYSYYIAVDELEVGRGTKHPEVLPLANPHAMMARGTLPSFPAGRGHIPLVGLVCQPRLTSTA